LASFQLIFSAGFFAKELGFAEIFVDSQIGQFLRSHTGLTSYSISFNTENTSLIYKVED
jgi:hypothetical protein